MSFGRDASAPGLGGDATIHTIDRLTGALVNDCAADLDLGSAEDLRMAVSHEGDIIAVGRYNSAGGGFHKMRIALSRMDLSGTEIWSRLVVQSDAVDARVYGRAMLKRAGSIYFVGSGDPDGISTANTESYLGKMSPDGDLEWVREYDFGNAPQRFTAIHETDAGLLIGCADHNSGLRAFVHVDDNGNVVSSGQYAVTAERIHDVIPSPMQVDGSQVYGAFTTSQYFPEQTIAFTRQSLEPEAG